MIDYTVLCNLGKTQSPKPKHRRAIIEEHGSESAKRS